MSEIKCHRINFYSKTITEHSFPEELIQKAPFEMDSDGFFKSLPNGKFEFFFLLEDRAKEVLNYYAT